MNVNTAGEDSLPTSHELDRGLEVLSNRHRRYVLKYIAEATEPVTHDELVDAVTAWKRDVDGDSEFSRQEVEILLHHSHLPKLENVGFVEESADGFSLTAPTKRTLSAIDSELAAISLNGTSGKAQ